MGYRDLINKVTSLTNIVPDGCKLTTSVRKTVGPGSWRLKGSDEILDDISLSFNLGYKLVKNSYGVDTAYVTQQIVEAILEHVNNFSEYEFSVNKMLDEIKRQIPTIDYFEFYDLNRYGIDYPGSRIAQTIYVPQESIEKAGNESLCVHYKAERTPILDKASGLPSGRFQIVFTPDITVKLIN